MPGLGRNVSSTCRPAMCGEPRGIAALVVDNLIFSLQHIKFLSHLPPTPSARRAGAQVEVGLAWGASGKGKPVSDRRR